MEQLKLWSKAAGIRALKTFAQTAVALIPVGVCINEVNWLVIAGTAAVSAILSILTSIAGLPEVTLTEELEETQSEEQDLFEELSNIIDISDDEL